MRALKYLGAAAALVTLAALLTAYLGLRGSLPRLDGEVRSGDLRARVTITRDARGVPTIAAASRMDLAWATGFIHAQDRFFEMDLSRRLAAGELAELFGAVALQQDRRARLFRFRSVAQAVLAQASPAQRALLEAYTRGVNAGLAQLSARPWEYWLLGQQPAAWRPEDSMLVVYAMWWDLQASGFRRAILRREINARLGGPECAAGWKCAMQFLYPHGTAWDAPDVSGPEPPVPAAPIPAASVLNVRGASPPRAASQPVHEPLPGSNSWALAGRLTATGAALVANDMHLNQRVPAIWYHARLKVDGAAADAALDLNGVTLPGAPLLVAGSNGHIAWGFTNSYGDWLDVQRVACAQVSAQALTTPAGDTVPLSTVREQIRVHGEAPSIEWVKSGPAGLLLREDPATGSCWFGSWLAQEPAATNMDLEQLERAASVDEALALGPQVGMPEQNFIVGDREGHIGWTIFGRIPAESGARRARSATWTTLTEHPRIVNPAVGRLWSANARVASEPRQQELIGGPLAALGAEYDLGARAGQIRDDLLQLDGNVTPADMLRIQLDDRALFLARWRSLLLQVLDEASLRGRPARAHFRQLVQDWDARAGTGSVGYRLVRTYHDRVQQAVWDSILAALGLQGDEAAAPAQFEGPLWQMLTAQPLHLLQAGYASWPQFLQAEVDATIEALAHSCPELQRCTWGARNVVRIRHPLSRALPGLAEFLDMPTVELPGDHDMPRVQEGAFGASERFAVSPGHEDQAYLELPGGQSGHPLSPYYRAGFLGWVQGEPLPLLPGAAQHTLTLTPN